VVVKKLIPIDDGANFIQCADIVEDLLFERLLKKDTWIFACTS
jgi:hypothetical protein